MQVTCTVYTTQLGSKRATSAFVPRLLASLLVDCAMALRSSQCIVLIMDQGAAKAAGTKTPAAAAHATVALVPATLKSAGICSGGTHWLSKFDANSPEQLWQALLQQSVLELHSTKHWRDKADATSAAVLL